MWLQIVWNFYVYNKETNPLEMLCDTFDTPQNIMQKKKIFRDNRCLTTFKKEKYVINISATFHLRFQ